MKKLFYRVVRRVLRCFIYVAYRPKVEGLENIPQEGRIILAGNHTNNLDSTLLLSASHRPIHFLGKHTLFKGLGKYIFSWMGVIPVNREKKNPEAVESALDVLKDGEVIGIFPEGTINKTNDNLLPFKYGAVSLASKSATPIVPFAITGHYKVFRKDLKLIFGNPIEVDNQNLKTENELLMKEVENLIERVK